MSLGIKREKVGDIIIHENFAQVITSSDICDFIVINLDKISRNSVTVKEISKEEIVYNPPNYKDISFTVSSERLDCIVSGIYNISRQDSLKYISADKVYVDYEKVISPSRLIKDESLISVRGKGRAKVTQVGDLTKKGKIKVRAKIIV